MKVSKRVTIWEEIWDALNVDTLTPHSSEMITVHQLNQKLEINSHILARFLGMLEQLKLVESVKADYTYDVNKRSHRIVKWYHKIKNLPFNQIMSLIQSRPKLYTLGFREMDNKVWKNRYWRE